NIYNIGQDAITIKNNSYLDLKLTLNMQEYTPMNCQAYLTNGNLIGKVNDIEFDDKFNIKTFMVDEQEIDARKMASHSKGTIIFYDDNFSIRVDKLKPNSNKIKIKENERLLNNLPKAYIMPTYNIIENNNSETSPTLNNEKSDEEKPLQKFETNSSEQNISNDNKISTITLNNARIERLTANSNLLIGKKITRTIATPNGELIGKKGNVVTSKTIYLATAHQKLRELILYCE
ncbi:MAG: hypothetical protein ACI4TX_00425, partial [Christensenellales bacterium]